MEILAILLGIYGAALSTILAIREISKDRRRVVLSLDVGLDQSAYLVVTNISHRPVILAGVTMFRYVVEGNRGKWDSWQDHNFFVRNNDINGFPRTLEEGKHSKFELECQVLDDISDAKVHKIRLLAWDVEGRKYETTQKRTTGRPPRKLE